MSIVFFDNPTVDVAECGRKVDSYFDDFLSFGVKWECITHAVNLFDGLARGFVQFEFKNKNPGVGLDDKVGSSAAATVFGTCIIAQEREHEIEDIVEMKFRLAYLVVGKIGE